MTTDGCDLSFFPSAGSTRCYPIIMLLFFAFYDYDFSKMEIKYNSQSRIVIWFDYKLLLYLICDYNKHLITGIIDTIYGFNLII